MRQTSRREAAASHYLPIMLLGFLGLLLLGGGASRADALSQPFVRTAAVLVLAAALYIAPRPKMLLRPVPTICLLVLLAIVLVQLVPLPPAIWAALPGHGFYADALRLAGLDHVWRPATLTPDLTLNTALALLPPLAALITLPLVKGEWHERLLFAVLVGILASASLAVVQISSGVPYLYRITNRGAGVGFFANQNHQAMFIACAFPILAAWAGRPADTSELAQRRLWLAACVGAALFPILLVTGSRSGLLLGLVSAVAALLVYRSRPSGERRRRLTSTRTKLLLSLPFALSAAGVGATLYLSRGKALDRLIESGSGELRMEMMPVYLRMIRDFFPVGSGFGSFDPVFRRYEPDDRLSFFFLNQAHSDWLQILIEGGLLAGLVGLAFLAWYTVRSFLVWRRAPDAGSATLGRVGSVLIAILLAGSLGDYPLRTPLLAVLFAMAAFWLHLASTRVRPSTPDLAE